jgi:hypothetical protein
MTRRRPAPIDRQDSLAALFDDWTVLLADDVDPMVAELMGIDFQSAIRGAVDPDAEGMDPLLMLIKAARTQAGPAALAMLQALVATAPAEIRHEAADAAATLTSAGVPDQPWVKTVGSPVFVAACAQRDPSGAQEAVLIEFRYRQHRHGIVVLLDNDLGGGVKDCWPTDDPATVRSEYLHVSKAEGLDFVEYERGEVADIVNRALSRPPCPQQEDQIEGVDRYLELLRRRVALLT